MHARPTFRPFSRLKILVVDDNPLLQRGLKEMLGMTGCACVVAADGVEAKAILKRQPVDLLVTDWVMQPVGGAALVRWVRGSHESPCSELPILVLTAQADVSTVRAAWDSGVDAVLAKPATAVEIVRRIEAVLRRPRRPMPRTGAGTGGHETAGGARPHANHPHGPTGEPVFPSVPQQPRRQVAHAAPSEPAPEAPPVPQLPSPSASAREVRRRRRLMAALGRLEAFADAPQANPAALWQAVADLQHAAVNTPAADQIASSLATCVTGVDPRASGFVEAFHAHLAALRWLLSRSDAAERAEKALVQCLRSTVQSLVDLSPT
ncbi:response regulator, partial [Azospirillum sp.]|uniref:response regulator n=1 Tax=Azospirillum sp. TaxID=34012 RepID=UPI002D233C95